MIATREEINKMNDIQFQIFKSVIEVCEKLNITYFMIHGSLLGTVLKADFMPFDDDIDIAMFRADYERFIKEGQQYLASNLFIQANLTDKYWPLSFAKVRDSNYTYIADSVRHLNINHGIFIDVFPIDYCCKLNKWQNLLLKITSIRSSCVLKNKQQTFNAKLKRFISCLLCPSWKTAIKKREFLLSMTNSNVDKIAITGGKVVDKHLPSQWFSSKINMPFRDINVNVPCGWKDYLQRIYGDYEHTSLLETKAHFNESVEINACILDFNRPYTEYVKWRKKGGLL